MKINKESPDINIDWTDEIEVDNYYKSFEKWKTIIRNGDIKEKQILEVKNNKIFYEGEYYLPYYNCYNGSFEKKFLKDGYIFGFCLKKLNDYWGFIQNKKGEFESVKHKVNIFYVEKEISDEYMEYCVQKEKDFKTLSTVDYLKKLDLSKINNKDLDLLNYNFTKLFEKDIFPYKTNNVLFKNGDFNRIEIHYRNRQGYLKINNGYWGSQPFKNDNYAILEACPYFTNVSDSYTRLERGDITWDKKMLDLLSFKIIETWNKAIELNYRNWG